LAGEAEKPAFRIEPLGLKHNRAAFRAASIFWAFTFGNKRAKISKKHAAVSFVLTPNGSTIAGYYTLSQMQGQCPGRGRKEIAEVSFGAHNAHRTFGGKR
jgi:hypothetical protein